MRLISKSNNQTDDVDAATALLSSQRQQLNTDDCIQWTRSPLSVDGVIETLKVGPFHYIFLIICGTCHSLYIIGFTGLGFILITTCDLHINPSSKGWLSLCFMFGLGFSSPIFGKLCDTYGRWRIMIVTVSIQLVSVITAAFSYNYTMLLVMYFMIGIGVGGTSTISPSYTIEFFPQSYRGFATGSRVAISLIANAYICLMALVILPNRVNTYFGAFHLSSWRIYVLMCILPTAVVYIPLFFMPESLRFVLVKGKTQDIMRTLDRMKQIDSCCIKHDSSSQLQIRSLVLSNLDELENEDNTKQYAVEVSRSDIKLYKRPWITRCLILSVIWIGLGFGILGFVVWLPTILSFYRNGNQCRYHGYHNSSWSWTHHLQSSNVSYCVGNRDIRPVILSIFYGSMISVPFALFFLYIINCIGRKWLFCLLIFAIGLCVLLILLIDNISATSILAVVFSAFADSIWIPLTTWATELFPTSIRSTAVGILHIIIAFIPGIGMLIVGIIFAYSCTFTLILFSALSLLAGLVSLSLRDTTNTGIN